MLHFVYDARLDPEELARVAPGARFMTIAHLPETRLCFPHVPDGHDGALPSVIADPGNTVWGAVFDIPEGETPALDHVEAGEQRSPTDSFRAVDREGTTYTVVTYVHPGDGNLNPSVGYLDHVIAGARHWNLPTGWVAGLEEHTEEPLI